MEGDQLIAQTRHLHLAAAASSRSTTTDDQMSDPDAGQSSPALSVPASPRSLSVEGGASTSPTGRVPSTTPRDHDVVVVDDDDTRTPPAARCDGSVRGHTGGDAPDEDSGDRDRGVRLGRSTAAAAARPSASQHGLARGLVDRDEVDDTSPVRDRGTGAGDATADSQSPSSSVALLLSPSSWRRRPAAALDGLPVEVVFHIMSFLDVDDLLSVSRTCHQLRTISLTPLLHAYRLQRTRLLLPPMLSSPSRPSLADLIARSIFLTQTTVVSRRLARSLVSIRLARRLAARPDPETLAERAVLPRECLPPRPGDYHYHHHHHHHGLRGDGGEAGPGRKTDRTARMRTTKTATVSPALVQQRRRVEKERIKDGLRRWVGAQWLRAVREKGESVRLREERFGVGRVWRLTRFWERVSRGEAMLGQ